MTTPDPYRSTVGSPQRNRRLVSALACAFVALISTVAWPASPAQAHTELTSSTPSSGARLAAAPQQIRLVFNEKVEPGFSTVAVTVGNSSATTLTARDDAAVVTADVPASANSAQAAGRSVGWKVDYRVIATDGHPVSGSISFSVAGARGPATSPAVPSSSAPTPTTAASSGPPANASATKANTSAEDAPRPIPLMLLVGGLIVAGVASAVWLTRAKPKDGR